MAARAPGRSAPGSRWCGVVRCLVRPKRPALGGRTARCPSRRRRGSSAYRSWDRWAGHCRRTRADTYRRSQALHQHHRAVEATSRDLTRGVEGARCADIHAPLGILRRAIGVPEVVVDVGVVEIRIGRRKLMTVVGLQGKEPRVVDPDLVTGLDAV